METSLAQKEPRVVNMTGPHEGIELKPFTLSFLEEVPQHNNMAGGHQTYYATGAVQDTTWDAD